MTVITIFLNPGQHFREAVDSVLTQTYADLEYLLVDDGSTDGSSEFARGLSASDPDRIRYLEHDGHANLGMSRSRNLGLHAARGELVAFLDADDRWVPAAVERQMRRLDAHPEAAMVIGATIYWHSWAGDGGRDRVNKSVHTGFVRPPGLALERIRQSVDPASMNSTMARRAAVLEVGGFEDSFEGMFEDQAYFLKFSLRHPVVVHDEVVDHYRQHDRSAAAQARLEGNYDPHGPSRNRREFRDFALQYVRDSRWRGSRVHAEAWIFARLDHSPRLSRALLRVHPRRFKRVVRRLLVRVRRT